MVNHLQLSVGEWNITPNSVESTVTKATREMLLPHVVRKILVIGEILLALTLSVLRCMFIVIDE